MSIILDSGDVLELSRNAAVLRFSGERKVLSTGALNGGISRGLTAVFNRNDCPQAGKYCRMMGRTMKEHQTNTASGLGLDPGRTTGLNTGANIDNTAINTVRWDDFSVTAIVTAGIEVNGCRVGSPASLHERDGEALILGGTVNIILVVSADLADGCMARALVTCTEAKVAAIQELMASDCYGNGLATGSGTDGTIIVSDSGSPVKLSEAGEHHKLGELIGKAVIAAVKEALYRQSGLCAGAQHSVFRRLERIGVTEAACWEEYSRSCTEPVGRPVFADMAAKMSADGSLVSLASLYAHLIDQALWGLLTPQEAVDTGDRLLELMNIHHGMPGGPRAAFCGDDKERLVKSMADMFVKTVVRWVLGSM